MVNKKCSKLVRLAINATMSGAVVVMGFGGSTTLLVDDSLQVASVSVDTPQLTSSSQPQVKASCRNLWGLC